MSGNTLASGNYPGFATTPAILLLLKERTRGRVPSKKLRNNSVNISAKNMRFGFGFSEICKQSGQITEHLQNNANSERFFNWIPKVQKLESQMVQKGINLV